jgi:hypothetical protein
MTEPESKTTIRPGPRGNLNESPTSERPVPPRPQATEPNPDPVLDYWKKAEITLHANGRDQKLTVMDLYHILHNIQREELLNGE